MNSPHPPDESLGPGSSDSSPLAKNSNQNAPVPVLDAARSEESAATVSVVGPALSQQHLRPAKPARVWLPVLLLLATCLSTFWAGAMSWEPFPKAIQWLGQWLGSGIDVDIRVRQEILRYAGQGLTYMVSVIAILFAHEMGHYVAMLCDVLRRNLLGRESCGVMRSGLATGVLSAAQCNHVIRSVLKSQIDMNGNGLTFSNHRCPVTVDVVDDHENI